MDIDIKRKLLRKKAFLLACFYVLFNSIIGIRASERKQMDFSYEINNDYNENADEPFAYYNGMNIYFCDSEKESEEYVDGICVVDSRNKSNSSIRICDSYRITNEEDMINILGVILEYEEKYPSKWTRTLNGLYIEWYAHNICYEMNILVERSMDVDLDQVDSWFYEDKIVKLIFGKK